MARDPYQVLGVSSSASAEEIKSAYRKLAKKLHPDVNPGRKDIEQKFKEITSAYDLLSDAAKRARFDRGEIDAEGQERAFYRGGSSGGQRSGAYSSSMGGGDPFSNLHGMDDILSELMGAAGRGRRGGTGSGGMGGGFGGEQAMPRGADKIYPITIPFLEACRGGSRRVTLDNQKTVDVTIPPAIEEGHKLRLRGLGQAGAGGAGDALVEIHIEPHPYFTRRERDIILDLPVTLSEAVLGATVKVPTLDGQVAVKVPKSSSSGTMLRLKGKGLAVKDGQGDMLVRLRIILPDVLPSDLIELCEKWPKKSAYDPRQGLFSQ